MSRRRFVPIVLVISSCAAAVACSAVLGIDDLSEGPGDSGVGGQGGGGKGGSGGTGAKGGGGGTSGTGATGGGGGTSGSGGFAGSGGEAGTADDGPTTNGDATDDVSA